jgi:hypothetical protein
MDSILSDIPTVHDLPETSTPAPESTPAEKVEAAPEPEKTEAKPAAEKATAPEHDGEDEQDHVPGDFDGLKRALAAARGDKRKARKAWQETEKQLAELRGRLSAMERPQPAQQQPAAPAQFDLNDETFFGQGPEAVKRYVSMQIAADREERRKEHLNRSEAAARERHEDFQEAYNAFETAARSNRALWEQAVNSYDPAEFAYKTGRTYQQLDGVSDLDQLKAKFRAEFEAEMAQKSAPVAAPVAAPPKSIAGARGSGITATSTWSGPRPIGDILR